MRVGGGAEGETLLEGFLLSTDPDAGLDLTLRELMS